MTRQAVAVVVTIAIIGLGLLMIVRAERYRDAQVLWWQTQRGVWAFRVLGAGLIALGLWGANRVFVLGL